MPRPGTSSRPRSRMTDPLLVNGGVDPTGSTVALPAAERVARTVGVDRPRLRVPEDLT